MILGPIPSAMHCARRSSGNLAVAHNLHGYRRQYHVLEPKPTADGINSNVQLSGRPTCQIMMLVERWCTANQ